MHLFAGVWELLARLDRPLRVGSSQVEGRPSRALLVGEPHPAGVFIDVERVIGPLLPGVEATLAGQDGADALQYQERDVREAVRLAREARGDRP